MCLSPHDEGAGDMAPCPWYLSAVGFVGSSNKNAQMMVWYTIFVALSVGLAFSGVTAIYLQHLTGSTSKVGYAEGVFGVMGLVPGLVGGYFSDKFRRDSVIRCSAWVNIFGSVGLIAVLVLDHSAASVRDVLDAYLNNIGTWKFAVVCAGVSVLYAGNSIGYASTQAVLADSLTTGDRQGFMTRLRMIQNLCYGAGPLICAAIVAACHDEWTETNLMVLVIVGVFFRIPAALVSFCFNDDLCLAGESDGMADSSTAGDAEKARYRSVPIYYFVSDVLWCFGSGMTVKFFPIFFKNDPSDGVEGLGLAPTTLFVVSAAALLLVLPMSHVGLRLSTHFGRIQTDIVMWYVGISSLAGMCALGYAGHYTTRFWDRAAVLVLYLNRTAWLQATGPIQQSVMMDFVEKKTRARWASAYAITGLGWCGSAAVGGWVVEEYSYNVAFLVTCCFHFVSVAVRYPLLCIVPKQLAAEDSQDDEADPPPPRLTPRESDPLLG